MTVPAAPRVRLVVLNFNGGDDVVDCVAALERVEWPPERLEVVVVDNASTDGSAERIAARFPAVRLIRSSTNGGFPANNLAFADLADAGVDYVGLVNNDAFVEPGFLAPLVATLEADGRVGAACPKVLLAGRYTPVDVPVEVGDRIDEPRAVVGAGWERPDDLEDPRPRATAPQPRAYLPGSPSVVRTDRGPVTAAAAGEPVELVNNVGNLLDDRWFGIDRGLGEVDDGRYDEPVEVFAWCGAAVLLRASYLQDVGGFDERLFLYYEDLDLSWRGRTRGWRYRTAPAAVVRHRLGASSSVGSPLFRYHVERNRLVVLAKLAPAGVALGAAARHLLSTASYARRDIVGPLVRGRRPRPALTWLRLRSFAGFVRLVPHALVARRRIRRAATVPKDVRGRRVI